MGSTKPTYAVGDTVRVKTKEAMLEIEGAIGGDGTITFNSEASAPSSAINYHNPLVIAFGEVLTIVLIDEDGDLVCEGGYVSSFKYIKFREFGSSYFGC